MWDTSKKIQVGDQVTAVMLGQFALEIDALHDGFGMTTDTANPTVGYDPINQALDNPNGLDPTAGSGPPPYIIYSFSNGYKRKPPYLITATFHPARATTPTGKIWIIRQPSYITDDGREYLSNSGYNALWDTEIDYNILISNITSADPDAYLYAPHSATVSDTYTATAMRFIKDDVPIRYRYTDGTTLTYYNDYYHLALAPTGGSVSNTIGLARPSFTIIGGR